MKAGPDRTGTPERAPSAAILRRGELATRFAQVREATVAIAAPLSPEDCAAQSMPDASPIQWHLAHTSWFFEAFLLARAVPGSRPSGPELGYRSNSNDDEIDERIPRPMRGQITRLGLAEILEKRRRVDGRVQRLLERASVDDFAPILEIGLNHEQQHQELMLTDLKQLLSLNPLRPAYREAPSAQRARATALEFLRFEGGLHFIGHSGQGFAFDNEGPRHRVFTRPFEIASRPSTNGEFLEFVEAGGYRDPSAWLSDGWDWVIAEGIRAPLYWEREERGWRTFTLAGEGELDPSEPVAHVSFYEADAFARWSGARLPRENEWEFAARALPVEGHFAESGVFHPRASEGGGDGAPTAMFGDVWEWTQSPYVAYPRFRPAPGALGEYYGTFIPNWRVLRGGSCVSPRSHLRATYRNFFAPSARWQFSGIRLARDV